MSTVADVDDDAPRLAAKLAKALADAKEAGDRQTVADLKRLPGLADEIAVAEKLYDERDLIFLRLTDRGVSQAVIGHAAKGSKSLVGYVIGKYRTRPAPKPAAPKKKARGA
jgi:hypothetical protein